MTQPIPSDAKQPAAGEREPPSFAPGGLRRAFLDELRARSDAADAAGAQLPRQPAGADLPSRLFEDFRRRREEQEQSVAVPAKAADQQDSIDNLFRNNGVLASSAGVSGSAGPRLGLPAVGDDLFGFRLRHELGRGAFARVFLAEQEVLAGRPVVLKVSAIDGHEPQTLAQLQHTHIVPIYSVHEDVRAGLRAVCMPYFGGASLSQVLEIVWTEADLPTASSRLVAALATVGGPMPRPDTPTPAVPDTCSSPLAALSSYTRAAVWIVMRLAEGLQHAHDRGVLHRDVKPSNVLLTADGQPMLLDFNLAHHQNGPQAQASATLGGTVAYMAPEHLRALASRDPALARQVDRRADIYSLGMVLYETLTGRRPFDQSASYAPLPALIEAMAVERGKASPSLRDCRPDVPWSLESILRKCLAPEPARRYQEAGQLAEDLERFLGDRPLKYAPELSRVERCGKWARRHPRLTAAGWVAAVAAVLVAITGGSYLCASATLADTTAELETTRDNLGRTEADRDLTTARLEDTRGNLNSAHDRERQQRYETGTVRALCRTNLSLGAEDLRQGLAECEQTLALYGVLDRDDWQDQPAWQRLDPAKRLVLAEDTRELLLMLAWARAYAAPGEASVLRDALRLLDRAQAVRALEPSRAVWEDRATYLEQLNDGDAAQQARAQATNLQPATARDRYLLALTYARRGTRADHARAIEELNEALRLNPSHYWSWMQRGFSYQEQGKYDLAAADFGVCIGLWPELAWGYLNRGYALYQAGHRRQAVEDYTAALERDPELVLAHVNRGLARLELQDYAGAREDYSQALCLGRCDGAVLTGLGMTLEGLDRHADADTAFQVALERTTSAPEVERTRILLAYGFAVSSRLPAESQRAFDEVLRRQPEQPQALYGRALLATRAAEVMQALPLDNRGLLLCLHREEALGFFDRALEADVRFAVARRYRGVLRARCGRFEAAVQDLNWCFEHEQPPTGATLYAAACVLALQAAQSDGLKAKLTGDQALDFLRKALAESYGREQGPADPDLLGIRERPEFLQLFRGRADRD